MEQPKRKIVVRLKKPILPDPPKKEKKPTASQLLALEGKRFYSFAWPKDIIERLHIPPGVKPNDYVLGILLREIAGRNNG